MLHRIEVSIAPGLPDVIGKKICKSAASIGLHIDDIRVVKVFTMAGLKEEEVGQLIHLGVLHDPVLQVASCTPHQGNDFDWALEVGFRPGVTDNEGRTAKETVALVLNLEPDRARDLAVYTAQQYLLRGELSAKEVEHLAKDLLANELIQRFEYKNKTDWNVQPGFDPRSASVSGQAVDEVLTLPISRMDDEALVSLSRENVLALSLNEMLVIKNYFQDQKVCENRRAMGLPLDPTDAELECLAQTWSEHCKHKIFNARIRYENRETGKTTNVDSLFKTCIQQPTALLRQRMGKDDFCLSVFKDNAGVVAFNEDLNVCIKVETHNSPSALDPYGGALTGIVGVNRDPMGTGLGAEMLCNMDVFCFASPFYQGELPPRLLHPRRVFEGVREGVEHGGNKSGIPTVNGSVVFHERFLGKPLVYCGTVGTLPRNVAGRPSHEKYTQVGDVMVMVGGRIGKDGIHGATFSSEELHEGSPATAVQIGDPITQRKMYDFLMRARDLGLYNAITDNGAGGLSSSVGEMAQATGGAWLDLAKAPLKYDGLKPWEILLSEAQERMSLAVPKDKLEEFLEMAREMDVEATPMGEFTDSGYFHVVYGGKPVAYLDMDFLHDGLPQMELQAAWTRPEIIESSFETPTDHAALLKRMLGRLNICSKEYVIRQYDHEVKGGSVVKPLMGALNDGPMDAAVLRPDLDRPEALVLAHGICPKFSDLDTYWMMANALDEAVRNAVAVGADPDTLAGVDNFCWCDPVESEKTPDGRYKLAQLVRANQALAHFCLAYGVPCISGKDSMKNDYAWGSIKISIPPTVLFTVIGRMPDASLAVTSDFKQPGDLIYILGLTRRELGGSELSDELGASMAGVPQVDALAAKLRYRTLHQAIRRGLITAAHDLSDGGLAVALAEMALAGRLGARVELDKIPCDCEGMDTLALLYSESASRFLITVRPEQYNALELLFADQVCIRIGEVTKENPSRFSLTSNGIQLVDEKVEDLAYAWKKTLNW